MGDSIGSSIAPICPFPSPGAREVLLRVRAAGINNTDINLRTGWYSKCVDNGVSAGAG